MGETPFSMVYGSEAMMLADNEMTCHRRSTFNPNDNDKLLTTSLDLLDEVRDITRMRVAIYQQRVAQYCNRKVRIKHYNVGDLVLRLILPGVCMVNDGTLYHQGKFGKRSISFDKYGWSYSPASLECGAPPSLLPMNVIVLIYAPNFYYNSFS